MNKTIIMSIQISLFSILLGSVFAQLNLIDGQNGTELDIKDWPNIHSNVFTDFNENVTFP